MMEGHLQANGSIKPSASNSSTPSGVETSSYVWALSVVRTGQMLMSPRNSATRCCVILVMLSMTLFLWLSKTDVQR